MADFAHMLIVGCGNMGGAMLAGWLDAGADRRDSDPLRFTVVDPALESAPDGVRLLRDLPREMPQGGGFDCILLGFKPQQLGEVAPSIAPLCNSSVAVFSLLAGVELASLKAAFPSSSAQVRVMPNLAARIRKSPVILCQAGLNADQKQSAFALFDALGSAFWLEDEARFDLVTALAGSGPGFVYRFIDALAQAGARLGLNRELSEHLALTTVEGAAALAAGSDSSPAQLADRVASPGGMTREGLDVLDDNGALEELLLRTLKATSAKGGELARQALKQP